MHLECSTKVDYLFQQRKPTKQQSKGITIYRNAQSQLCLSIGKGVTKGAAQFKLEESLSKVYKIMDQGKCTIELKLAGGSTCNVLISGCEIGDLTELIRILTIIDQQPENTHEIDLSAYRTFAQRKKSTQVGSSGGGDDSDSGSEDDE